MMAKFARVKPMIMARLRPIRSESSPIGTPSRSAEGTRGGIDQPKEIAAVPGVDDIQVEEQVPACKEQPVQEERHQEQAAPGGSAGGTG